MLHKLFLGDEVIAARYIPQAMQLLKELKKRTPFGRTSSVVKRYPHDEVKIRCITTGGYHIGGYFNILDTEIKTKDVLNRELEKITEFSPLLSGITKGLEITKSLTEFASINRHGEDWIIIEAGGEPWFAILIPTLFHPANGWVELDVLLYNPVSYTAHRLFHWSAYNYAYTLKLIEEGTNITGFQIEYIGGTIDIISGLFFAGSERRGRFVKDKTAAADAGLDFIEANGWFPYFQQADPGDSAQHTVHTIPGVTEPIIFDHRNPIQSTQADIEFGDGPEAKDYFIGHSDYSINPENTDREDWFNIWGCGQSSRDKLCICNFL